jgi:4-hydroxybenzoate polyprenyltransferase
MISVLQILRPYQWVKNFIVFMPLFFGHQLMNVPLLINTIAAFFAFSFVASSIYCFNDIIDVEDDRRHVEKCHRPIASGKISVATGYILMFVMLALSIALSFALPNDVVSTTLPLPYIIIIYWLMEMAYCIRLKRIAIIDLCILSMGFLLRIAAGGAATGILLSHWLIMMTFLLTLFLGFAKRRDDVLKFQKTKIPPRHNTKRYNLTFVNDATTVTGSVMLVCYIMYTVSPETIANFDNRHIYLTTIFVLLGVLRYMQLAVVDDKSGDPTKILLRDHFTQVIVLCWVVSFLFIIYIL